MGGKKQYTKEVLEQKTLYPEKQISWSKNTIV
jgi:hypothetical protein